MVLISSVLLQCRQSGDAAYGIGLGITLLWLGVKEPGAPGPAGVANCVCSMCAVGTGQG